jgi:hypothetical protein
METVSAGLIEWAVAELVLPGQTESGDRSLVTPTPDGWLVAVVDGLGHGGEAAEAAKAAVRSLERHAHEPIVTLIRTCHRALAGTRGVVMSVAAFDARAETVTWVGVGNVEGVLLRAQSTTTLGRESLLLRGGVVGVHLPALAAAIVPVTRGDELILATDGVQGDFAVRPLDGGDAPQQLADHILERWGTRTDDALVLVARYLGPAS